MNARRATGPDPARSAPSASAPPGGAEEVRDDADAPALRLDLSAPDVEAAVEVAAVLSDRSRAAILRILVDGPHCVCELAAALDERQNNVSNHLARLRDAGLVRRARHEVDSRRVYYERDDEGLARAMAVLAEGLR